MGDGKKVITLADNHLLLWDLQESSSQAVVSNQRRFCVSGVGTRGQTRDVLFNPLTSRILTLIVRRLMNGPSHQSIKELSNGPVFFLGVRDCRVHFDLPYVRGV